MGFQPVGRTPGQIAADKQKVRRSKLRPIDAGTRYDLTGNLRRVAREIERGERGDVRDLILVTRTVGPVNGRRSIDLMQWGTASIEETHWMLQTAINRIEPA